MSIAYIWFWNTHYDLFMLGQYATVCWYLVDVIHYHNQTAKVNGVAWPKNSFYGVTLNKFTEYLGCVPSLSRALPPVWCFLLFKLSRWIHTSTVSLPTQRHVAAASHTIWMRTSSAQQIYKSEKDQRSPTTWERTRVIQIPKVGPTPCHVPPSSLARTALPFFKNSKHSFPLLCAISSWLLDPPPLQFSLCCTTKKRGRERERKLKEWNRSFELWKRAIIAVIYDPDFSVKFTKLGLRFRSEF